MKAFVKLVEACWPLNLVCGGLLVPQIYHRICILTTITIILLVKCPFYTDEFSFINFSKISLFTVLGKQYFSKVLSLVLKKNADQKKQQVFYLFPLK